MLNRTFCEGDNLEFLLRMPNASVDLIATDPPFNKNKEFQGIGKAEGANFKDYWSWQDDVHNGWLVHVRQHWPALNEVIEAAYSAHSPSMAAFLAFMSVRLIEMHRILKPEGSLYLHCDPTANAYLRLMLDAVFGREGFRNEITWNRSGGKSDAGRYGRVSDRILYYAKGSNPIWNKPYIALNLEYVKATYQYDDKDGRGRYTTMPLHAAGTTQSESGQPWRGYNPTERGNHWRTPTQGIMAQYIIENDLIADWPEAYPTVHARLDAIDKAGLIVWSRNGVPRLKTYLAATKGIAATDIVNDIPMASGKERYGWPTQKPLALYRRIIEASSNEGDLVLDPFAGCATTCVAAEQLGRQWIGIDISPKARGITLDRLRKEAGEGTLWESEVHIVEVANLSALPDGITAALATPALPERVQRTMPKGYKPEDVRRYLAAREAVGTRRESNPACQGCGYAPPRLEYQDVDHIEPRASGGADAWNNFCVLCRPCNRRKAHKLTIEELRAEVLAGDLMLDQSALMPMDAKSIAQRDRALRPLQ